MADLKADLRAIADRAEIRAAEIQRVCDEQLRMLREDLGRDLIVRVGEAYASQTGKPEHRETVPADIVRHVTILAATIGDN